MEEVPGEAAYQAIDQGSSTTPEREPGQGDPNSNLRRKRVWAMKLPLKYFLLLCLVLGAIALPLGRKYFRSRKEAKVERLIAELTTLWETTVDSWRIREDKRVEWVGRAKEIADELRELTGGTHDPTMGQHGRLRIRPADRPARSAALADRPPRIYLMPCYKSRCATGSRGGQRRYFRAKIFRRSCFAARRPP